MEKHRYELLVTALNVSINQFEKEIGVKPSRITKAIQKNYNVTTEITLHILGRYPKVSEDWLRTGEGEMFKTLGESIQEAGTKANNQELEITGLGSKILALATKMYLKIGNDPDAKKYLDQLSKYSDKVTDVETRIKNLEDGIK